MGSQVNLGEVAVCANGHVWMLGSGDHQGEVFFNQYDNPNGGQWYALPDKETFTWITCGSEGTVWTVSSGGNVFFRDGVNVAEGNVHGDEWHPVACDVKITRISADPVGNVWALTTNGLIKRRTHIDCDNPRGQYWESVASDVGFKELSVGDSSVYALDEAGSVYRRMEVSADNGVGCDWERLSGIPQGFIFISGAEINLVYAIATDGSMWYLYPGGIWVPPNNGDFDWTHVEGGPMLTLDVGKNGRVVGTNAQGNTYFREGVSATEVTGTNWAQLDSERMAQVTVCSSGVYLGLSFDGGINAREGVNDDTP